MANMIDGNEKNVRLNEKKKKGENILDSEKLNNFMVSMRESIRQARVHIMHRNARLIKQLSNDTKKKTDSSNSNTTADTALQKSSDIKLANKKKATKLSQELKAIKSLSDGDLAKLVLLEKNTLSQAYNDNSSGGRRAVCRVAEHATVSERRRIFYDKFGDSTKELSYCIKVLGTKRRPKKMQKLEKQGKKKDFLQTEHVCFQLFQEIGGADFAAAENLHDKLKKKKKNTKTSEKVDDSSSKSNNTESLSDEKDSDDETEEKLDIRNKIFEQLDSKFGKWEDDGPEDSDLEDIDLSPSFPVLEKLEDDDDSFITKRNSHTDKSNVSPDKPMNKKSRKELKSEKKVKSPDAGSISLLKLNKYESQVKLINSPHLSKLNTDESISTEIQQADLSKHSSKLLKKEDTVPKANGAEVKQFDLTKLMKTSTSLEHQEIVHKASGAEVKQLDLTKMASISSTIQLGSKKRPLEFNPEDEILCDLPKKMAYKRAKKLEEMSETQRTSADFIFNSLDSEEDETQEGNEENSYELPTKSNFGSQPRKDSFRGRGKAHRSGSQRSESSRDVGGRRGGGAVRRGGGDKRRGVAARTAKSYEATASQPDSRGGNKEFGRGGLDAGVHPSWAAKMNQSAGIGKFKGKKTTFE